MIFTACAANSGSISSGTTNFKSEGAYEENAAYDSVGGSYSDISGTTEEALYEDGGSGEIAEAPRESVDGDDIPEETTDTEVKTGATIDREKIVYSGSLSIETLEYGDTVEKIYKLIEEKDGIIQSENSSEYSPGYSSDRTAHTLNLTVRIPAKQFRSFIKGAQGIGKVKDMNTYADNITRNYYDVASRRASLRTELDRLNELLATADTTEDLLAIMDRIASVQGDLDSLEAQLRNMDTDVAYSTLTIDINEVVEYSVTPQSFGERVADAIAGSWHNFIYVVQNLIILLIYLLPAIIVFIIFAVVVLTVIITIHKKHPPVKRGKQVEMNKKKGFFHRNKNNVVSNSSATYPPAAETVNQIGEKKTDEHNTMQTDSKN